MSKRIHFKALVDVDGNLQNVEATAKEYKAPQHKGYFMTLTDEVMRFLKPFLTGDDGRVLQILFLNIDKQTGLVHLNQKQICNEMGYKDKTEKNGKPIVSRGIKKLIDSGFIKKTIYKNSPAFVFHPSVNRGKYFANLRWKEAIQIEEDQKQKALEKAREILNRIKNSASENVDSEIESAIQSFDSEIQDELSWDNAQEWDGESL